MRGRPTTWSRRQPGPGPVDADGVLDAPTDDEPSPFWTGLFGGEAVAEDAAPFAGWGEDAPPTAAEADQSPWADQNMADASGAWNTPDGPSATWALGDLHEAEGADATPFQGTLDVEDIPPEPFASIADASGLAWAAAAETSAAPLTEMLARHGVIVAAGVLDEASRSVRGRAAGRRLGATAGDDSQREPQGPDWPRCQSKRP